MKRLVFASVALSVGVGSAALAADLPPPMAPPPRAPAAYIPVAAPSTTGPASISAAISALVGTRAAASRTRLAAPSRDRDRPPSFWAAAKSA